jgi:hypothetical protein
LIIAICVALSAAATPLLESSTPVTASATTWVREAQGQLATCQNDVGFLVRLGRMLLMVGQPEEAAEHIERALLLSPEDPAALRAFAAALSELGDSAAARQVLSLAPGAVMQMTTQTQWRSIWGMTLGAERNLLGLTSVTTLTLTLPGLDTTQPVLITLPLDPSTRPRGGGYWQAAATGQWLHRRVGARAQPLQDDWTLQASAKTRQAPSLLQAGFAAIDAAAAHQRRFIGTPWGHHANIYAAYLESRTGVTFTQAGVGAGVDWFGQNCHTRMGVEWVNRHYAANSILDGRQSVAQLQWACSPAAQLVLRTGADQASSPQRPGGNQTLMELRFRGSMGRWAWEADWTRSHDAVGYSPLLDSGARRYQLRRSVRIDYVAFEQPSRPLKNCADCRSWQVLIGLEGNRRVSNIELFKNNNLGLFTTIQWIK